jgi:hypothetical protein
MAIIDPFRELAEKHAQIAECWLYGPEWPRPLTPMQQRQHDVVAEIAEYIRKGERPT